MLSINIPIYNYYVDNLVAQLINQIEKLDVPCEIRLYDDGSSDEFVKHNATLANNEYVIFKAMNKNMGRSAIRNKMGQESKYQYLLFIDADSKLISDSYLQNYLDKIDKNTVLCGGTAYSSNPPTDKSKMLRWKYGCVREAIAAEQRNSKKGFIITSNNFLIEKSIFTQTLFREEIQKYGHEDTLLGFDLFKKGVAIKHINNAVEHTGLESAEQFIAKT
ncbi:MAG: glycosyl transferase, partial [Draconibacterium sp.]